MTEDTLPFSDRGTTSALVRTGFLKASLTVQVAKPLVVVPVLEPFYDFPDSTGAFEIHLTERIDYKNLPVLQSSLLSLSGLCNPSYSSLLVVSLVSM